MGAWQQVRLADWPSVARLRWLWRSSVVKRQPFRMAWRNLMWEYSEYSYERVGGELLRLMHVTTGETRGFLPPPLEAVTRVLVRHRWRRKLMRAMALDCEFPWILIVLVAYCYHLRVKHPLINPNLYMATHAYGNINLASVTLRCLERK